MLVFQCGDGQATLYWRWSL